MSRFFMNWVDCSYILFSFVCNSTTRSVLYFYCVYNPTTCCCNLLSSTTLLIFSTIDNSFSSFFKLLKFCSAVWSCFVTYSISVSSIKASHDWETCSYSLEKSASASWIFYAVSFTAFHRYSSTSGVVLGFIFISIYGTCL